MNTSDLAAEPDLVRLHEEFADQHLAPLWTQRDDLMPMTPSPEAVPHVWRWDALYALAQRSGTLVPVGRGGERRAIGLANPGLPGTAYATPTLWCAIQYLGGHESAPEHRHSQNAFRFVVAGEGVWTVVDGDPVAMRRGDLLLTAGWQFHGHHNHRDEPMAWIDGLDVPLARYTDVGFFEFGPPQPTSMRTPARSRGERLWAHPGLCPLSAEPAPTTSPLAAYRWEYTDAALTEQLALESEGHPGPLEPGHAGIRYVNPATGGDVLPTIRCEMHRVTAGTVTPARREVGSSVWQVFQGQGAVTLAEREYPLATGDLFVIPSWVSWSLRGGTGMDLFRFSDAPVMERLGFARSEVVPG